MKLRSMIGFCALAVASVAVAVDDIAGNTCGLMNVPSTAAVTMIAVPWVTVGGTADAMKVANLVKTDTLTAGDELYYYDGSTYYRWTLTSGVWTPSATTKSEDGKDVTVQAPDADYGIARGKGLFLVRQNTSSEIWLYGQSSTAAISVTVAKGTATAPAYTMLANPNTVAYGLNEHNVEGADGDMIQIPGDATVYTYKGDSWGYVQKTGTTTVRGKTIDVMEWAAGKVTVPAGQGVWYVSKGGEPTIAW